jgi:hypothetical protein
MCIYLSICTPLGPNAQETGEIVTDRPDQTESSVVLSPGYLQLETGFTHVEDDDQGIDFRGDYLPETLVRIGICERWELRFVMQGYAREKYDSDSGFPGEMDYLVESKEQDEGWQDSEVGLKYQLWTENADCFIPEAAFLTHLSLPIGDRNFSTDQTDPSFRFLFAHTITDSISLGYNLGAAWETEEDDSGDQDTLSVFQYTVSVGKGINDKWGVFVELFGDVPMSAEGKPSNSLDGGVTYLVADNFQLDFSVGTGLSEAADDFFVGAGVSYRWPR